MFLLFIQLAAEIAKKSPATIEDLPSWQALPLTENVEQLEWGLLGVQPIFCDSARLDKVQRLVTVSG